MAFMMWSDLEYFRKACECDENVGSGGVEPGIGFCLII